MRDEFFEEQVAARARAAPHGAERRRADGELYARARDLGAAGERVLVCISEQPGIGAVVRYGRRMAEQGVGYRLRVSEWRGAPPGRSPSLAALCLTAISPRELVEPRGIEPLTSTVRTSRSPI